MIAFVLFFGVYLVLTNYAVSMGYHRYLAHKSFQPAKWFEYLIITLGLPAGTPIQWAGNHRFHHLHADTDKDPHSPHFGGFWHSHCGWYLGTKNPWVCFLYSVAGPLRTIFDSYWRPRTNQEYVHLAKDIARDPYYRWISHPKVYLVLCLGHVLALFWISILLFGNWGILAAWFCSAFVYNLGDSVDSVGHIFGKRNFPSTSLATDSVWLGILAFGDGWHSTHHRFPNSARHGILKGQWDWTYTQLRFLKKVGIVRSLTEIDPSFVEQAQMDEWSKLVKCNTVSEWNEKTL